MRLAGTTGQRGAWGLRGGHGHFLIKCQLSVARVNPLLFRVIGG
ncbi:MAG: hypothetical protein Q7U12_14725 [Undibacterium sp.]|nr:hypothetical protein [Undibacterium sp.]